MMEVQQRLACLSPPSQRLTTVHSPASSLRQLAPSPLTLPLSTQDVPPLPSTMIIDTTSLKNSDTTPPDSPQQGETVPTSVSDDSKTSKFSLISSESHQKDQNFAHDYPNEETDSHHPLWGQPSDMANGVEEFSQCGMAREGVEDGSASPVQESPRDHHEEPVYDGSDDVHPGDHLDETPPNLTAPGTPGSQEFSDRRNRRKQTIEDIVRRITTSEQEELYHTELNEEDSDPQLELAMTRSHLSDDEVDGAPLEISRQILNAQACAESAIIKQSLHNSLVEGDEMEPEEDISEYYPPENFLNPPQDRREPIPNLDRRWEDHKLRSPGSEFGGAELGERKAGGVTILPKTSLPPHTPPSLAGGLHSSLPMSNISETAYSPHHFSTAKMGNSWYPGPVPPLFPHFSPGLMDPPLGPKFLPFEGKLMEVDKDYLKCQYCERTFRRQKNLENHVENTHQGKGGQRPKRENGDMYFKCTHCPYTTKHQSNLYVHLRIHTGERPYICGACGVQYSQSHSLKSHIINKHEGHMNFYIKEKRNRSPRGLGYMSTHVSPGDQTIFKIPPPPVVSNMQQSNLEMVARAIEFAKNSLNESQGPPPPLLHPPHPPSSMHHNSPMMSPNGPITSGHHGIFHKAGPGFPFNGHFPSGLSFPDLSANPNTSGIMPHPSPNGHINSNSLSALSPNTSSGSSSSSGGSGRNELLNLSMSGLSNTVTSSAPGFSTPSNNPHHLLSPAPTSKPMPSPNGQHAPITANTPTKAPEGGPDCAPIDLSTRGGWQDGKGPHRKDCPPCISCAHGNKLKLLRLNVVRMLSILVPNLNFEEKGISADSDSVDELLQDVIESNTHDDDMVH